IGNSKYWIGSSLVLVLLIAVMLPLNAFVFKGRGHMLNWGIDFRGGTEMVIEFSRHVEPGDLRRMLAEIGHDNADVVRYGEASSGKNAYLVRLGAVSVLSAEQAKAAQAALAKEGE